MARGSIGALRRAQPPLRRPRPGHIASVSMVSAVLTLSGCLRDSAPPPTPPAPTLEVVIATQGPPPVPTPGKKQLYVVRDGDTLSGIAARFGVAEEAVLKQNPDLDPDTLFVGQELVIPPAQP